MSSLCQRIKSMPIRILVTLVVLGAISLDPKKTFAAAQTAPTCPIGEDSAREIQMRFRLSPADRSFFSSDEVTTNQLLNTLQGVLLSTLQTATGGRNTCQSPGEIGRLQVQQITSLSLVTDPVVPVVAVDPVVDVDGVAVEPAPTLPVVPTGATVLLSDQVHILAKVEVICHDCNLLRFDETSALSLFGEQPLRRQRRNQEESSMADGENGSSSSSGDIGRPLFTRQRHMQEFVDVGTISQDCYCDPFIGQSSVVQLFNDALLEVEASIASIVGSTEVSPLIEVLTLSEIKSEPSRFCQTQQPYTPFESYILLTVDFLFINSLDNLQVDLEEGLLRAYNDVTAFRNDDDRVCDPLFRLATQVEIVQQEGANGFQVDPTNVMPGSEVVLTAKISGMCRGCEGTTNLLYTGEDSSHNTAGGDDSSSFPVPPVGAESSSTERSGGFLEGEWGLRHLESIAATELVCLCPVDTREYRGPTSEEYLDAIRQSDVVGEQGLLPLWVEEANILDECEDPVTVDLPIPFTEIISLELQVNCSLIDNDSFLFGDTVMELYNWYSQVSVSWMQKTKKRNIGAQYTVS
jgi:hypothetical protein